MFSFIKMKLGFYRRYVKHKATVTKEFFYLRKIRKGLKNKDFTIISNNCWGGSIYEDLELPYKSPTIGLFFFAPCYLEFLSDLKGNLKEEIVFISRSKYEKGNELQKVHPYPIGLIKGKIEVHFLHYQSESEALKKWRRRAQRVNFDNIFFSFTDNEVCTVEEIKRFDNLPCKKVFFSSKQIEGIKSLVVLKDFEGQPGVGNIYDDRWKYRKYFNVVRWLNS